MVDSVPSGAASPGPAPVRDFDGLYKSLFEAHPEDVLHLLCGARLDDRTVILDGPTEHQRQRGRTCDKVFRVQSGDGMPADIYHIEVQLQRTEDFQLRMVEYWTDLARRYRPADHRIHQVVLWPLGKGHPGRFSRDRLRLEYRSVSIPEDLDADVLLAGPLAPLALWSRKPPPDLVERVVARIAATGVFQEQVILAELGMLVGGDLAVQVLEALRRSGMNNILEQTESGREIARKNLELGVEFAMQTLLRKKYGELDDLDDLAHRLAERDFDGNMTRILNGATVAELRS